MRIPPRTSPGLRADWVEGANNRLSGQNLNQSCAHIPALSREQVEANAAGWNSMDAFLMLRTLHDKFLEFAWAQPEDKRGTMIERMEGK